jgi:hypothetical protein
MYYSYNCPYCSRLFYTYNSYRKSAASVLYYGIKDHLIKYNEDHKEFQLDDPPRIEINDMLYNMSEHETRPRGGYFLKS